MLDIGVKKIYYIFLLLNLKYIKKEFCPNIHNIFWMNKNNISNIVRCNSFLSEKNGGDNRGREMNLPF